MDQEEYFSWVLLSRSFGIKSLIDAQEYRKLRSNYFGKIEKMDYTR